MTNGNMLIQPLLNIQPNMWEKMKEEILFFQIRKYSPIHATCYPFRTLPQTISNHKLNVPCLWTQPTSEPAVILFTANQTSIFGKKESLKESHRDVFEFRTKIHNKQRIMNAHFLKETIAQLFLFFSGVFCWRIRCDQQKVKWVDFLGRRADFESRYGSCPELEKKFFT